MSVESAFRFDLQTALQAAVPLHQMALRRLPAERLPEIAAKAGDLLTAHGDDLLFGGRRCAETFNALARGLAALSFCPDGVTAFGTHWEMPANTNGETA